MKIHIEIRWWREGFVGCDSDTEKKLEQIALNSIFFNIAQGLYSGEMDAEVNGVYYNGAWEFHRRDY